MGTGDILLGLTLRWTSIPSRGGGGAILSVASCYRNLGKLWQCGYPVACLQLYLVTLLLVHVFMHILLQIETNSIKVS